MGPIRSAIGQNEMNLEEDLRIQELGTGCPGQGSRFVAKRNSKPLYFFIPPSKDKGMSTEAKYESVVETSEKLAQFMRENPNGIDAELVKQGENLVGVYADPNFKGRGLNNLYELKKTTFKQAVDDIAGGVMILRSSVLGVTFRNNKLMTFVSPHGTLPQGTVVFSLTWKDMAAFKRWRNQAGEADIPQDVLNSAIYFLTAEISKLPA